MNGKILSGSAPGSRQDAGGDEDQLAGQEVAAPSLIASIQGRHPGRLGRSHLSETPPERRTPSILESKHLFKRL